MVRLEDHYKPRMRRNDSAKPKAIADKPTTTKATANVKKAIDGADFWAVIDNALADILTAKEKESFLKNLKKVSSTTLNFIRCSLQLTLSLSTNLSGHADCARVNKLG